MHNKRGGQGRRVEVRHNEGDEREENLEHRTVKTHCSYY